MSLDEEFEKLTMEILSEKFSTGSEENMPDSRTVDASFQNVENANENYDDKEMEINEIDDVIDDGTLTYRLRESSSPSKVSLRMEILLKKERQKQIEEAQFTYRPKLLAKQNIRKESPPANRGGSRFDKLYTDALKRHITSHIKEESALSQDKDLTFTPKISSKGASSSRSASKERLMSASRSSSRSSSASRDSSRERGRYPGDENLTFKPKITKRAKSIDRQNPQESAELLYQKALLSKAKLEQLRSERSQRELEGCTFSPKLIPSKAAPNTSKMEVTERLSRYEEFRKKRLEERAEQIRSEEEEKLTFKPTLLSNNRRHGSPTNAPNETAVKSESATKRLSAPIQRKVDSIEKEMYSEATFQPKLVAKRAPSPAHDNEAKNVHVRLFSDGLLRKKQLAEAQEKSEAKKSEGLTFQPKISPDKTATTSSPKAASTSPKKDRERESVFERLHYCKKEKIETKVRMEKLKTGLTKDLTFSPQLSSSSLEIATRNTKSDLGMYERQVLEQEHLRAELQKKHEDSEAAQLKDVTGVPVLPKSSVELAHARRASASAEHHIPENIDVFNRLHYWGNTPKEGTPRESCDVSLSGSFCSDNTGRRSRVSDGSGNRKTSRSTSPTQLVVSEEEALEIANRLASKKTRSFSLKTDPELLEAAQREAHPPVEGPKVSAEDVTNRLSTKPTRSFSFKVDPAALAEFQQSYYDDQQSDSSLYLSSRSSSRPITPTSLLRRIPSTARSAEPGSRGRTPTPTERLFPSLNDDVDVDSNSELIMSPLIGGKKILLTREDSSDLDSGDAHTAPAATESSRAETPDSIAHTASIDNTESAEIEEPVPAPAVPAAPAAPVDSPRISSVPIQKNNSTPQKPSSHHRSPHSHAKASSSKERKLPGSTTPTIVPRRERSVASSPVSSELTADQETAPAPAPVVERESPVTITDSKAPIAPSPARSATKNAPVSASTHLDDFERKLQESMALLNMPIPTMNFAPSPVGDNNHNNYNSAAGDVRSPSPKSAPSPPNEPSTDPGTPTTNTTKKGSGGKITKPTK